MKTILFMLASLISPLVATGQPSTTFNYSAYSPVTSGVFADSTFPAAPVFRGATDSHRRQLFTLKNGIFEPGFDASGHIIRLGTYLKSVDFVDVTGDGRKDAIVVVGNLCDCSGVWFGVYVYRMAGPKPGRRWWSFRTGDRADGGLHHVFGHDGKLVLETYGAGSGPGQSPKRFPDCMLCAYEYTRRKYAWIGNHFAQYGKLRVIPLR